MTRLLMFIVICFVSFLVVKFLIKITSFIIKIIIWLIIVGIGIYVINYFIFPKFNKKPYDINKKFINPLKNSTTKVVSNIDKEIIPKTKKIKKLITKEFDKKIK